MQKQYERRKTNSVQLVQLELYSRTNPSSKENDEISDDE